MTRSIADLIARVESDVNPYAMRYEAAHTPKPEFITTIQHALNCSHDTATMICKSSWGQYQIMGDELVELGLSAWPGVFLNNASMQTLYFNSYLTEKKICYADADTVMNDAENLRHFAETYNGPGNVDAYVARMQTCWDRMK